MAADQEKTVLADVRQQLIDVSALLAGVHCDQNSLTISLSYETVSDVLKARNKLDYVLDLLSPIAAS